MRSSTFGMNVRFETSLKYAGDDSSAPAFLRSGLTTACFHLDGKWPMAKDWLKIRAMKGASSGAASFISHARSMSREHCFAGDEVMTLMSSSVVIGRNPHMPGVWQVVKVASRAQDVDARISAILFSMWL